MLLLSIANNARLAQGTLRAIVPPSELCQGCEATCGKWWALSVTGISADFEQEKNLRGQHTLYS